MKYLVLLIIFCSCSSKSWRDASRESINIALPAKSVTQDTFQIYYARAYSWRGYFAVHPWVAWIKKGDKEYTIAQVSYWKKRSSNTAISIRQGIPDRRWFDNAPTLLYEVKGKQASKIIKKVKSRINDYPYAKTYTLYPGPNSNTFVAYLIKSVDEIKTELPPHAIGKDYAALSDFLSSSPSSRGFQISLYGLLGLTVGLDEGIEFNIIGLNFGIDILRPAIKLPFIGRLGVDKQKRQE